MRTVLVGKSGSGKSSLANTIFGEELFETGHLNNSDANLCHSETRSVHRTALTLTDTPGLIDPGRSEEDAGLALLSCVTEAAPGPHAFLILLKAEKFTQQEKAVVAQIRRLFPGDVLQHAVVVFTRGDQLPEGTKVKDFADANESLRDLVEECGGRCHVVDNKYWKNRPQEEYRSNRFQVAALLQSIQEVVEAHGGRHYTDERFEEVEREIQEEEKRVRRSAENMSEREVREQAKARVFKRRAEGPKAPWLPKLAFAAGVALLAIVSALLLKWKFVKESPAVPPLAPLEEVVVSVSTAAFSPEMGAVEEAEKVMEIVPAPEAPKKKLFEVILDMLYDLYGRIYDPWNPFD